MSVVTAVRHVGAFDWLPPVLWRCLRCSATVLVRELRCPRCGAWEDA